MKKKKPIEKILEYYQQAKKILRNDRISNYITYNKWLKQKVRDFQKRNNGIDPRKMIPKNTLYCYQIIDIIQPTPEDEIIIKKKPCPYHYTIEIPQEEQDQHPGIIAMGQTCIGGCKFINKTDDDMNGWGLLWDECKECGYNYR